MGWNDFSLPVVGVQYHNEDGSSRQEELRRCEPGEPIWLERQPDNPHDRNAIAVFSDRRVQVGYIAARHACWLASKIDREYPVHGVVGRIKGAMFDDCPLGMVVRLNMEGEEPEMAA